jgi:hypothetical protein
MVPPLQRLSPFVVQEILGRLDKFVDAAENTVDNGNLDEAERIRLEFKRETSEMVKPSTRCQSWLVHSAASHRPQASMLRPFFRYDPSGSWRNDKNGVKSESEPVH